MKKDNGKDQADVIVNISGNITKGQVMAETSKLLWERFGKIMQGATECLGKPNRDSISHSTELENEIPTSKVTALSSDEFVGLFADNPEEKIKRKMFHNEIINDAEK